MQLIKKLFHRSEEGPSNSLFTIFPYKNHGIWMFDEPQLGLFQEAFVAGMPEIIEDMTHGFEKPESGFIAIFSAHPFPTSNHMLHKTKDPFEHDGGTSGAPSQSFGTWYKHQQSGKVGWLCPALFKFFPAAPDTIWVAVHEFPAREDQ